MYIRFKPLAVFWRIILAVIGTVGLLMDIGIFRGTFIPQRFEYFTTLSNVFVVIYFYVLAFWQISNNDEEKTCIAPWLKGMITLSICVTGLIAHIILNKGVVPSWKEYTALNILHYITPFMVVIDWLFFDKKGNYKTFFPFIWCIPAYVYMIYTYISVLVLKIKVGMRVGSDYPYDFLDIAKNGIATTLSLIVVLTLCFIILGYVFLFIDQFPARFSAFTSKFKKKGEPEASGEG